MAAVKGVRNTGDVARRMLGSARLPRIPAPPKVNLSPVLKKGGKVKK